MSILKTIGNIYDFVESIQYPGNEFDLGYLVKEKQKELLIVKKFFKPKYKFDSDEELLTFCICLYVGIEDNEFGLSHLARCFSKKKTDLFLNNVHLHLKSLIGKDLIALTEERGYHRRIRYCVNEQVLQAILYNKPIEHVEKGNSDTLSILIATRDFLNNYDDRNESFEEAIKFTLEKLKRCNDPYILFLKNKCLNRFDLFVILIVSFATLDDMGNRGFRLYSLIEDIYKSDFRKQYELKKEFVAGSHSLLEAGLLQIVGDGNGALNQEVFVELGEVLKVELSKDQNILESSNKKVREFQYYEDESQLTQLFFDTEFEQEINRFVNMIKRIEEIEFGSLCAMFTGSPGLGKTEVISHIAFKTGRPVLQLSLDSFRSSYFSESEKQVVKIFQNIHKHYKNAKSSYDRPIVFIDESDGLFDVRNTNRNNSVESTENRVQSILLSEVTRLPKSCVLIACSNSLNYDAAFFRRFQVKIAFKQISFETRLALFNHLLPESKNNKDYAKYVLSPSLIHTVVQHAKTDSILFDITPDYNRMIGLIENELSYTGMNSNKKVGF